jgi:replicative DNA helicase
MTNEKLNEIEKKMYEYQGEDRMVSSLELAEIISNEPEPVIINSGFPTLDKVLNGFEGGELVVVTGPTNHGKTTMLLSIAVNMIKNDIKSSFFTLENSPRNLIKKLSNQGAIPLFYLPLKNTENQIEWLIEKIIEGCVKFDTKVVFIDHLHQIFSMEKMKGNLSLEIGDIVAKLKSLAVDYGIVVFLVAHSTDGKYGTGDPTIRDIRDSGMISRLADTVFAVWRIQKQDTMQDLLKEPVALQDDGDGDNHYNKIRIWKSRREGKWGTFFVQHENHQFTELTGIAKSLLEKTFHDEKKIIKKTNQELGFD